MKEKNTERNRKPLVTKEGLVEIGIEILGSFLIAIGIYNFAVNANFPMTGFSGISIILYRLFQIPIGMSTILLNIPVTFLCYRLLGKRFLLRSLRCMVISSLMIDYLAPLLPVYGGAGCWQRSVPEYLQDSVMH